MYPRHKQSAFSLVELSIVLVILGLLTGGILGGQALIRAAELRSVSTDFSRYLTAVGIFRDKYFALPGDMSNATQFWTAQNTNAATCRTSASSGTATCDGNGDGVIRTMDGTTTYSEWFRAWQHLANAGLVEGSFTGVSGPNSVTEFVPGTNCPRGKLSNSGYSLGWIGTTGAVITGHADWFDGTYGNVIAFGRGGSTWEPTFPALRPDEAWNLDTKLDDGQPSQGRLTAFKQSSSRTPNCTTSDTSSANYNLANSAVLCSIAAKTGF